MSIAVKFRRGTTAEHSTFTGLEGEITVDTTKDTIVVHDGVTAGGVPMAKEAHAHNAVGVALADTGSHFTATDVEGALSELFTSVSNGKTGLVADIQTKGGTVTVSGSTATFSELSTGVLSIPTGGGATGEYRVRFIDYDGTVLKEAYCDSGGSITAPNNPDHTADGLTFQGWNYPSSAFTNITSDLDVGATYITTDEKTHLYITLTIPSGKAPTLYFYKSDSSTLSVDWGDGNTSTFTNNGNFNTGAHTYSEYGSYVIKAWISSGSGTYNLGQNSSSTVVVGGSTALYQQTLTKAFIGLKVAIGNYAFTSCLSLRTITLPTAITSIGDYAFQYCRGLLCVVFPCDLTTINTQSFAYNNALLRVSFPSGVTTISTYAFQSCAALESVVLPSGITTISSTLFNGCYSLSRAVIPSSITSIGSSAFKSCNSLSSVILPNGLLTISTSAFEGCTALSTITLPSTITSIGATAFSNCYSIRTYIVQPTSPPTLSSTSAFTGILPTNRIKVPSAALSTYQSATNWSTYANYMEGY